MPGTSITNKNEAKNTLSKIEMQKEEKIGARQKIWMITYWLNTVGSDDKESNGVNRSSIAFDLYLLFLLLYTSTSIMDFVIKFVLTFLKY